MFAGDGVEVGYRYRSGLAKMLRFTSLVTLPTPGRLRGVRALRFIRRWGPHRVGYHLGIPRSTVGRVLDRYRMLLLAHLEQTTGLPVRKRKPVRYEGSTPGELVHVGIKKLGRIADGGGHRMLGRTIGNHGVTRTCTTPSTITPG